MPVSGQPNIAAPHRYLFFCQAPRYRLIPSMTSKVEGLDPTGQGGDGLTPPPHPDFDHEGDDECKDEVHGRLL